MGILLFILIMVILVLIGLVIILYINTNSQIRFNHMILDNVHLLKDTLLNLVNYAEITDGAIEQIMKDIENIYDELKEVDK